MAGKEDLGEPRQWVKKILYHTQGEAMFSGMVCGCHRFHKTEPEGGRQEVSSGDKGGKLGGSRGRDQCGWYAGIRKKKTKVGFTRRGHRSEERPILKRGINRRGARRGNLGQLSPGRHSTIRKVRGES